MWRKTGIVVLLAGLFAGFGYAGEAAGELTVDEIVSRANHAALYQGIDGKGKVTLVITDKQGRTRKREFNMLRRDDGEADRDQKYYVFFQEPADVRKMVFMVHKHAEPGKDDDRWLYMPSLDLVKRIAAGDKRTSFVGSDFLYEDISGRNPVEDIHELTATTETSYILKNTPKNRETVEFDHYVAHIDKRTFIPMKLEYFKQGNMPYRVVETLQTAEIECRENEKRVVYPTVTESMARSLESGSTSRMVFTNIQYNIGLSDDLFSERYLRRPPKDAMQ